MTLDQLRDQAKKEALDYLTNCVLFALAEDKIVETEALITQLAVQQTELETIATQLRTEVASLQAEIVGLSSKDDPQQLQKQLRQGQESLTTIKMRIDILEGQGRDLQTQIAKFRSVTAPKPPRGLKNLVIG